MDNEIKNKEDAEKVIEEEIKKIRLSEKEIDLDEILKKVHERLHPQDESVQNIIKNSMFVRGSIIETSIHLENILNEILLNYYNPQYKNNFEKDFLFKALSLRQKKEIINSIIEREELKEKSIVTNLFGNNFDELIRIRNIYAHRSEDVFSDSLSIEISHKDFKSMKELNTKFMEIAQKIYGELINIAKYVVEKMLKNN